MRREQRCQLDFAALQVKERQVSRRRMEREEEEEEGEEGGFPHETVPGVAAFFSV